MSVKIKITKLIKIKNKIKLQNLLPGTKETKKISINFKIIYSKTIILKIKSIIKSSFKNHLLLRKIIQNKILYPLLNKNLNLNN
jgi:hypothetical protein